MQITINERDVVGTSGYGKKGPGEKGPGENGPR